MSSVLPHLRSSAQLRRLTPGPHGCWSSEPGLMLSQLKCISNLPESLSSPGAVQEGPWRMLPWVLRKLLTGRFSLTASTGCWKGHANWCFHSVLSTTLSRYCSWLVCLLGLLGLEVSGGGGLVLAVLACWGWAWACVVDIWVVSSPSPITGRFLNLVPGPLSADMLLIPSHSSPGTLKGKRKATISGEAPP